MKPNPEQTSALTEKQLYHRPKLREHGSVSDLTRGQGVTTGDGNSGQTTGDARGGGN